MNRYKYPRTPHLPWSEGGTKGDSKLYNIHHFIGKKVYVTEKLDGENTTLYRDYMHARSIDSPTNFTRSWVQNFHRAIAHNIPEGWRIVGENVWAEHSIRYENLKSYFYPFAVYDDNNFCLSFDDTEDFLRNTVFKDLPNRMKIPTKPKLLYRHYFNRNEIESIEINKKYQEGYVVRTDEGFHYDDFELHVAKYVRKNHVQTDEHWLRNAKRNGELII